jgi:hypothetical protein
MEDIKKIETSLGINPTQKFVLNKQIGQLKKIQNVVGKDRIREMIEIQNLTQKQKDYIYMKMGWF